MDDMEFIDSFFSEYMRVIEQIDRMAIKEALGLLYNCWAEGGAVFIMGNGGSASTATHFACDLSKVTIVPGSKRLKVMSLADNIPLVSAWTNDSGFGSIYVEQLRPWLTEKDLVIVLSVHGGSGSGEAGPWSQNLMQAMALAKERGAATVALSGFGGGAVAESADVCLVVPIDEEPLGTPIVESFHTILHHLIAVATRRRIESEQE